MPQIRPQPHVPFRHIVRIQLFSAACPAIRSVVKETKKANNERHAELTSEELYTDAVCDQISNINYNSCSVTAFVRTHKMFRAKFVNTQARRSWVQFPVRSLDFSIYLMLAATLWPWGQLSL
jgi:hypothetical protein